MTENEALEYIKNMAFMCGEYEKCQYGHQCTTKCLKATEIAIKSLSEIQQYRAIGLTPELIEAMQGHNVALINDLGEYQAIGTVEEFKALKEKNVAKKPRFYAHNYYCTECGNLVGNNEFEWQRFLYCDKCGQKLDWQ